MSSTIIKPPAFLFPDPVPLDGLISWFRAETSLRNKPEDRRRSLLHKYSMEVGEHPHPVVRTQFGLELEKSSSSPNMILLCAVRKEHRKTYVSQRHSNHAYELVGGIWEGQAMPAANPVTMADTGRFSLVLDSLPRWVAELAEQPLFLGQNDFKQIWRPYAGTRGKRLRSGRTVIERFLMNYHNGFMTKEEYKTALWEEFPGATARALEEERLILMPEWKGHIGGRPKR